MDLAFQEVFSYEEDLRFCPTGVKGDTYVRIKDIAKEIAIKGKNKKGNPKRVSILPQFNRSKREKELLEYTCNSADDEEGMSESTCNSADDEVMQDNTTSLSDSLHSTTSGNGQVQKTNVFSCSYRGQKSEMSLTAINPSGDRVGSL